MPHPETNFGQLLYDLEKNPASHIFKKPNANKGINMDKSWQQGPVFSCICIALSVLAVVERCCCIISGSKAARQMGVFD